MLVLLAGARLERRVDAGVVLMAETHAADASSKGRPIRKRAFMMLVCSNCTDGVFTVL